MMNYIKILSVLVVITFIISRCNSTEQDKIERKYKHQIYPEDTSLMVRVDKIAPTKIKKVGDITSISTNNIYVSSNNITYLFNLKTPNFKVGDSLKIEIKRVKPRGDVNDVKIIIYPKFGSTSEAWGISNETARTKMLNDIRKSK